MCDDIWYEKSICTVKYSFLMKSSDFKCFFFVDINEAEQSTEAPSVPVCPETGSTENQNAVATSSLENNLRVWWPTWHLNFFFFFFTLLNKWPHLDLCRLCRNQPSPKLVQNFNGENSQHTARHESRTEHTHKARTINLWLVRTFTSQTCIWEK